MARGAFAPLSAFLQGAVRVGALGAAVMYTSGAIGEGVAARRASLEAERIASAARALPAGKVDALSARAGRLERNLRDFETMWRSEVQPLQLELSRRSDDAAMVRRISIALVREGHDAKLDPKLLLSVLLVENPWLAPDTTSLVGAVGLMQVMPIHAGGWGCASDDLTDPETNICHGARILAHYLRQSGGDLDKALLRYNGCVRGTNTPDCDLYPMKVYRNASLAMFRAAP